MTTPAHAAPMPRSRGKQALFRLLTVVLVLLVLEGAARVYRVAVPASADGSYGYPQGMYVWHESYEYALKPGFRGFFTGARFADVPIDVNADGYRDRPFLAGRTPGVQRIVFLGDSITFGSGVPPATRFTDRLARTTGPHAYETLNLAVNSYTLFHYLEQARLELPKYDPEVVVVGFCLNDLQPKETCGPRKSVRAPDGSTVGRRFKAKHYSALAAVVSDAREKLRNRPGAEPWARWMRRIVREWENEQRVADLRRDLTRLQDEVQRQERRLLVVAMPEKNDLKEPDRYGAPRRMLLSLLADLEIEHLDLYAVFAAEPDPEALFLSGDSLHLSPRGHAVAAEAIAIALTG